MELYGIPIPITNIPKLDPGFIPIGLFNRAFLATAKKPLGIAVERAADRPGRYLHPWNAGPGGGGYILSGSAGEDPAVDEGGL